MPIKKAWNYLHKGLLTILSILTVATLAVLVFLVHTLFDLNNLINQGGNGIGGVLVLQSILSDVQTMQTSVRGYVLTGDVTFLNPYDAASKNLPNDLRILRDDSQSSLTKTQITQISTLAEQTQQYLNQTKQAYDSQGIQAATASVLSKSAEHTMSQLRDQISSIASSGLRDIGPQQQRARMESDRAVVVGAALAMLVFGSSLAVLWYFQRALLKERALENSKSEFLSLASHQLRTPATNVKQYIGLLMDGYMGDITDRQRKALEVAYKNNESEIKIMNDLLDVAKLDLQRIQLNKTVTNVVAIAREVVRNYGPVAAERDQTIEYSGAASVMASVDKTYIRGVLENLVDNAIKYSHPGTKIKVSVTRENGAVCIAVKDRGLGIKKRDYGKLFNKFSRLANEFSANSEGSGLGLYWVRQVVKLHGGWIHVASRDGHGSIFSIYLPAR